MHAPSTSRLSLLVIVSAALLGPYVLSYAALRWRRVLVHSAWWDRRERRTHHDIDSDFPVVATAYRPLGLVEAQVHAHLQP